MNEAAWLQTYVPNHCSTLLSQGPFPSLLLGLCQDSDPQLSALELSQPQLTLSLLPARSLPAPWANPW